MKLAGEGKEDGVRLGYLLSRYPLLSETFIRREIEAMRQLGHQVAVAALQPAPAFRSHPSLRGAEGDAVFIPETLSAATLGAHLRRVATRPIGYAKVWSAGAWSHKGHPNALGGCLAFWPPIGAIAERWERCGVEHIHAHYATHPAMAAWLIHRLTGIPFSFTVHAHDLYVHRAGLGAKIEAAAWVVAVSAFNRDWLQRLYPRHAGKIVVVHCGIRPSSYAGPRRTGPPGELRLVSVASLEPYKGHRVLVEACDLLRGRMDFTCRLIGWGPLGPALAREIRRRGLQSVVHLTGPATEDEVGEALKSADVFVLPSVREPSGKMEGIPVALMEAMAAGLPVVASRLSGIPELVEHEASGLLTPPGDAPAVAEAIGRLRDPRLRARLAAVAQRQVAARFDLERCARQLAALLSGSGAQPVPAPRTASRLGVALHDPQ